MCPLSLATSRGPCHRGFVSRVLYVSLALLALTCDDTGVALDDIGSACRRQAECATSADEVAPPESECRDRFTAEYDEATGYGCGAAYSDWVSCLATTRGQCRPPFVLESSLEDSADPSDSSTYVDPCRDTEDALRACQGRARRDACVVLGLGGAGGCDISCALFSGQCSPPAQAGQDSTCSCAGGDKTGATFSAQCGSDALETLARDACQ